MIDHLAEAKRRVGRAASMEDITWAQYQASMSTAHGVIALVELLAERLPLPAETASARHVRLQKEEYDGV